MVFPIPDKNAKADTVKTNLISTRKKKKKSKTRKNKKRDAVIKKQDRFVVNMSSWAEQFTMASTWQMKHQLAYWKAKAVSLEYENKILHDIIRKNCSSTPSCSRTESESDFQNGPVPKMYSNRPEPETSESEGESEHEEANEEEEGGGQWEVSEEFIEFLTKNAKFKEEARRERERLKAKNAKENEPEIGPPQPQPNRSEEFKELYGTNWQKIAALEMSIQSNFILESDKMKPKYWPNIPFNLS